MSAQSSLSTALREALPSTAGMANVPDAVLMGYQQRWIADTSQFKVAEKSRRVGLTWAEAADAVLTAAADVSAGGMIVYYIGYNRDMAYEFIEACAMWARAFNRAAGAIEEGEEIFRDNKDEEQSIKSFSVKFPSAFRIVALSSRPANLRGKQGVAIIDEAAIHMDFAGLLKAVMAFFMWGGKVRIISTHLGEANPFNELIQDMRTGKQPGSIHRIRFEDAIADGLYQRVCLRLGRQWSEAAQDEWVRSIYAMYRANAAEELDVIPSSGTGAYLPRALIMATQDAAVPVVRLAVDGAFTYLAPETREQRALEMFDDSLRGLLSSLPYLRTFYGCDFARVNDLSVIWVVQEQPDCSLKTVLVLELRNMPYDQQRQLLFLVIRVLPRFSGGAHDKAGNGGYLAEAGAQEFGELVILQVHPSQGWYLANMPKLKAHFEDRTFTTPADADVLSDFRSIVKKGGVPKPSDKRETGADGLDRHGDAAVAAVMAVFAVEMCEAGEIEFQTTGSSLSLPGRQPASAAINWGTGFGTVAGNIDLVGFN